MFTVPIKYILKPAAVAVFFSLLCSASVAQKISAGVDKKVILIGEQINYDITITLPSPEYKVALNIPDSIPHFEVLSKTAGDTTDKDGNFALHAHLIFTSFDSGSYTFPALQYRINRQNTASQPLYTDSLKIDVGYMPLDKGGQPRDIKTVLEVEVTDWFWICIAAGIIGLLIFIYLFFYFRKRKASAKEKHQISASAYEEALNALKDLRKRNTEGTMAVKDFHTTLAHVFKKYYGTSTGQDFMNNTTTEILNKLKKYELTAITNAATVQALQTGDAVKFAKYHPTQIENEAALDYVKDTIEEMEQLSKK